MNAVIGLADIARVDVRVATVVETMSEVLTLGVPDADGRLMLIGPDRPVPAGGRLY